jgi:hypothetical protein
MYGDQFVKQDVGLAPHHPWTQESSDDSMRASTLAAAQQPGVGNGTRITATVSARASIPGANSDSDPARFLVFIVGAL